MGYENNIDIERARVVQLETNSITETITSYGMSIIAKITTAECTTGIKKEINMFQSQIRRNSDLIRNCRIFFIKRRISQLGLARRFNMAKNCLF